MKSVNGWQLYYFKAFQAALDELEAAVTQLAAKDPKGYKTHPKTKLLASVYRAITQQVPANPDAPEFRLGKTLGAAATHWRRIKKGMPESYRLFFRFASSPIQIIIYVWFNDENTLRKASSRSSDSLSSSSCCPSGLSCIALSADSRARSKIDVQ